VENTCLHNKPLLTRTEVANILGVSIQTVSRMCARGELETRRIGERLIRIPAESIGKYTACLTKGKAVRDE
jgi:excisionase family DNA binding protein